MQHDELLPWFAPKLSHGVSRLILNIGRRCVLQKGQGMGNSTFFNRVVYVKQGFLAQGLINPGGSAPFMLTLAGPGSFGITGRSIDHLDNLPRRYWASTYCEVMTAVPELLLRLAEVEPMLNKELAEYSLRRAVSERLGLMMCHAAQPEDRLGVFLMALVRSVMPQAVHTERDWIQLPTPPSRKVIAAVLACSQSEIDRVLRAWCAQNRLRFEQGSLWVPRILLLHYTQWLEPFLHMHGSTMPRTRSTSMDGVTWDA